MKKKNSVIFRLESYSWNSSILGIQAFVTIGLITSPFHPSDVKAFFTPCLVEALSINSSLLMILVCPPPHSSSLLCLSPILENLWMTSKLMALTSKLLEHLR